MIKKILAFLLFSGLAFAQSTTTVTGNLKNLGTGTVSSNSFVRFYLRGCSGNQPRINGTAIIAPTQGNVYYFDFVPTGGAISGTLYSTRDAAGTGNGAIECGGSFTSVWYGMVPFLNGKAGPETPVHAKASATLDISNVSPISTTPVVTAPTGDSTYARLDGGNSPFTGNETFNANVTVGGTLGVTGKLTAANAGNIGNVIYTVPLEAGSTTCGVQEAYTALPSTGGKIIYNHQGQCVATTGISFAAKPVILEGLCTVATTTSTYSSFISCGELKNGTTGSDLITVTIPAGTFISGFTIKDISLEGNQFVGGATAGSNLRILGGSGATVLRDIDIDNVISRDAFQAGFRISNNSFLVNFFGGGAFNNNGDGLTVDATTGNPSQIYLYGFRSDLNTGCGVHASSAGGGNGGDIYVFGGTMSDSSSGICVDNGSSVKLSTFGVHFEHNNNDGIHYFGSSQHSSSGDVFYNNVTNDYNLSCVGQGFGSEFIVSRNPTFLGLTPTNWRIAASCNRSKLDGPSPASPVIVDAGSFSTDYILNTTYQFGTGAFTVSGTPFSTGGTAQLILKDTTSAQATPNKGLISKSGQLQFNNSAGTQIVAMDDTGDLWPSVVNSSDLGLNVLPWRKLFLGTAGTNNFVFTPAATAAARTVTISDPLGNVNLPFTIASGSTALNTASITTATCDAGKTATATGTASTDTVDWSFNAAPTATNKYGAFLVVYAVPSANTVTFYTCNPSATTSTPTAMTVNWSVRRP